MLTKRKAFFRFEALPEIGAGHAIRTSVIVDVLRKDGWECIIISSKDTFNFVPDLKRFHRVNPLDFYNKPQKCDLMVFDGYDFDETYEKHFRQFAEKILVVDDLANRKHDCDILLDQTFGRKKKDYKDLVPEECKLLVGNDYILLRNSFIKLRSKTLGRRKKIVEVNRILVSMGGSDPKNLTLVALRMIKRSGFKGYVDIVLGFDAENKRQIEEYTAILPNKCKIYINPDLPKLMSEADLALGASGISSWERCCLGLPSVSFIASEDQNLIANDLEKIGATRVVSTSTLEAEKLLFTSEELFEMSEKSSSVVKGNGMNRIKEEINELY